MGLFSSRPADAPERAAAKPRRGKASYTAAQNAYHKAKSADSRDIATQFSWEPKDPGRREACKADPERGLRTYFSKTFYCTFSPTHQKFIAATHTVLTSGGQKCESLFRGGGKTAIFARMLLLAIANATRQFGLIVGATDNLAETIIDKHIKRELTDNEMLAGDYPELCNPFIALEDNGRRCKGQLFNGTRTLIEWAGDRIVAADIPPSAATGVAGSVIATRSITGAMRGLTSKLRNGRIIRPDVLLLDDIQTRESAGSPVSTGKRIAIVNGDALGLAGHDRRIAAMMAVTPIYENDLACQFLDRAKNPEWRGTTTSMVIRMPEREDLWDEYRTILHDALKNDSDPAAATRFYETNRQDMDRGAEMAWPERIPEGYLSAMQYAQDLKARDPEAFAAEYQCRPLTVELTAGLMLTRDDIATKTNGHRRGTVPPETDWLTAFVDVNDPYLFWAIAAWKRDFTGSVIDYGAWPPQTRRYTTKSDANPTIASYLAHLDPALAGSPTKTLLAAALDIFLPELLGRTWADEAQNTYQIKRLLIDTRYEGDVVRGAIERLQQDREKLPVAMPAMGSGLGAKQKRMADLPKKAGDIVGSHWRAAHPDHGKLRHVSVDTNYWKTTLHQQLAAPLGQTGCFALYGDRRSDHSMMADHLTAENPTLVTNETRGEQKTVVEWLLKPGRENEGLDCLVGCFVGAAMLGCELPGAHGQTRKGRRHFNMASYQE